MKFEITILGCGGAIPTLERNPTSQYLNIQDRHFLIDCGEGFQIQLRKYNCKFSKIDHIFISHLHGDHFLGLFGYLSTLSLLGRTTPINIYAPKDLLNLINAHNEISGKNYNFDLNFNELASTTNFWFFIQKITVLIVMSVLLFMGANFLMVFLSRTQVVTQINDG